METSFVDLNTSEPDWSLLDPVITALQQGEVAAFPTETVYGLGGDALQPKAVERIYQAKGRPSDNPLIVHIGYESQLEGLVFEVPETAKKLIASFWPGPLTLLFNKKAIVPDKTTGGLSTVAVRIPSHPIALQLLQRSLIPLAAPSANTSGKPSPTTAEHVAEDLSGKIPFIIDGGPCDVGVESTIIDVTTEPATLLRPGGITREEIESCVGKVALDPSLISTFISKGQNSSSPPRAPGMKYRHYSPDAKVVLVEGNHPESILQSFCSENANAQIKGIVPTHLASFFDSVSVFSSEAELAHHLFSFLRDADHENADYVVIAGITEEGIGFSVMNRIRKAASLVLSGEDDQKKE